MPIFYNPKMRENRDLSIMMILYLLSFNKNKVRMAFPMSATGIRELRLLSEHKEKIIEHSKLSEIELLVNDINAESLRVSKREY
jgi:tRNA G26 N,N-dimethylase Trm1